MKKFKLVFSTKEKHHTKIETLEDSKNRTRESKFDKLWKKIKEDANKKV